MDAQKATTTIARMARLLAVSRSGYYAWVARRASGPSRAQRRRDALTAKFAGFYQASDQVYGSPRILADLREAGEQVSRKTVAKRMASAGIVGISPRKFTPLTTLAGPDLAPVPDRVGRVFDRGRRCGLDQRHHLPGHRPGLALSVCGPRPLFEAGDRLGGAGPHARRPGRGRATDGGHLARVTARPGGLPRRPRQPSTPRLRSQRWQRI